MQPGTPQELDRLMRDRYADGRPSYFRMSDHSHSLNLPVEFGKGNVVLDRKSPLTIITAGPLLAEVYEACGDMDVNLLYFSTIKPIDKSLISRFANTEMMVVEDAFGLFHAVSDVPGVRVTRHGIPDEFCVWYGTVHDIRKKIGLDASGIREAVRTKLNGVK